MPVRIMRPLYMRLARPTSDVSRDWLRDGFVIVKVESPRTDKEWDALRRVAEENGYLVTDSRDELPPKIGVLPAQEVEARAKLCAVGLVVLDQ